MSHGVEWALHCCLDLVWLAHEERPVPAVRLAALHDLPPAYLNKHLQALTRAGVVASTPGKNGGFRLAYPPERVSLMDIIAAVEGQEPAFRCTEIRLRGLAAEAAPRGDCVISQAMRRAELAWRSAMAAVTLADIAAEVEQKSPGTPARIRQLANA